MNDDLQSNRPEALDWGIWTFVRVAYGLFADNPKLVLWMVVAVIVSLLANLLVPPLPDLSAGLEPGTGIDDNPLVRFAVITSAITAFVFAMSLLFEMGITANGLTVYRGGPVDFAEGQAVISRRIGPLFKLAISWLLLAAALIGVIVGLTIVHPALGILASVAGAGVYFAYLGATFYILPLMADTDFGFRDLLRESASLARASSSEIVIYWILTIALTVVTSLISSDRELFSAVAMAVSALASAMILSYLAVLRCGIYENALNRFGDAD